jgi:hypothetical protein
MRNIGKGRQVKFVKTISNYLHEVGAEIHKERCDATMTRYKLKTKAGILYLSLETPNNEHCCFTLFGRFENPAPYEKILGERLNKYSYKWNFHHSNENYLFRCLQIELKPILLKLPITKWDDLKVNTNYEGRCKLNFDGHTYESGRASIDPGEYWSDELPSKDHKSFKVVMVDACACFIRKSSKFQLWMN